MTILYNALIILVKFSLAPAAIYISNVTAPITFPLNNPVALFFIEIFVFLGYAFILYLFYRLYKTSFENQTTKNLKRATLTTKKVLLVAFVLIAGLVAMVVPAIFILAFFLFALPLGYIFMIFSSAMGLVIAGALIAALTFLAMAFSSVEQQAVLVKDVTVLSTFFVIALSFLFVYHVLWVVYVLLLFNLWPLKIVLPK